VPEPSPPDLPNLAPVLTRFQSAAPGLPKHARLRDAFVDAIAAGELAAGTKVVAERELSRLLGLSLGTTQKGLNRLTHEGFLVRRQGHGTFVGSQRRAITGSWHLRFLSPGATGGAGGTGELPVYATIVDRRLTTDPGPWVQALGPDPKGYVFITRRLDVGGQFTCASHMVLPASRFARLLRMAHKRLDNINLKQVLAEEFSAPTLAAEGLATVVNILPDDAALMGLPPRGAALQVHITAYSFGHVPITFQRVIVPASDCAMKLDFNPPDRGGPEQRGAAPAHVPG
jgi:DNA-binding GntR family transcriptional regulator